MALRLAAVLIFCQRLSKPTYKLRNGGAVRFSLSPPRSFLSLSAAKKIQTGLNPRRSHECPYS